METDKKTIDGMLPFWLEIQRSSDVRKEEWQLHARTGGDREEIRKDDGWFTYPSWDWFKAIPKGFQKTIADLEGGLRVVYKTRITETGNTVSVQMFLGYQVEPVFEVQANRVLKVVFVKPEGYQVKWTSSSGIRQPLQEGSCIINSDGRIKNHIPITEEA